MASNIMFDRKWEIVLRVLDDDYRDLVPPRTKTIRDLKVTFNIRNTMLGDPSLASFQIFNVNSETVDYLSSANCFITFKTGYYSDSKNDMSVLFEGEVTNSYSIRQGVDIVYNVWARHAFNLIEYTHPIISPIQNPVSPKVVLEKLTKAAVGLRDKPEYVNNCDSKLLAQPDLPEFTTEKTFRGEFSDILDPANLGWMIQQDTLVVFDKGFTDPAGTTEQAIKVSNKTGLLSVPSVDYTGIKFTSLLNGKFQPTKVIDVEPNTAKYNLGNEFYVEKFDKVQWRANGRFRIYEVTHQGDTRGDRWETDVTAFYRRN